MAEYIDLDTPLEVKVARGDTYEPYTSTLRELLDANHIPYTAANVRTVVHGEWERKLVPVCDDGIIMIPGNVCSKCGGITTYNVSLFKYCPRCGAQMDGGV